MKLNLLKQHILSNKYLSNITIFILNVLNSFRINIDIGNKITSKNAFIFKTHIKIRGKGNEIGFSEKSYLSNCSIEIFGHNNSILISKNCRLTRVELHIEDNNNQILIDEKTTIEGKSHFACIEGTKIRIGSDCMFSKNITFRTGDSHSIIDENGLRINPSRDISIGNHVWVGNRVIVTKGGTVGDNSIIGTGSIVTKAFEKSNIIVAGSPAKIVKEGINWSRKRI